MATVYILKDIRERIYIGSTVNFARRMQEHQRGHTTTTRKMDEWHVVWKKDLSTLVDARVLEKKIKKWKSRKMVDLLIHGVISI